jgi:hypothetical protein
MQNIDMEITIMKGTRAQHADALWTSLATLTNLRTVQIAASGQRNYINFYQPVMHLTQIRYACLVSFTSTTLLGPGSGKATLTAEM